VLIFVVFGIDLPIALANFIDLTVVPFAVPAIGPLGDVPVTIPLNL